MKVFTYPKVYTDKEIDESPFWAEFMDIGSFLWDSAQDAKLDGKEVSYLSDYENFVLGHYFTETVFGGNIGAAYEYALELKPYNYV